MRKEKEDTKAEKEAKKAAGGNQSRLVMDRRCSNLGCPSTTTMKTVNKAWYKCPTKRCTFWACHLPACHVALKQQHCNTCNT